MCGLLGFTGHGKADPGKIRVLFLENESRGGHSTGMWGSERNRLMRKAETASKFIQDANFDTIARSNVVIGHTRYSTGTARTKENAHPFVFGDPRDDKHPFIVGSHNGSIFNEYEMEQKIKGFERAEVDSKSIFKAMYQTGDHEIFNIAEGHLALAFYFNGTMLFYRRESRPLYIGRAKEGYYYSSLRDGLKKISIPDTSIMVLNPHRLIGFSGSKLVYRKVMSEPRVILQEHHNSYNWDNGVSAELKEELTGKKPYTVATTQVATGQRKHGAKTTTQDTPESMGKMGWTRTRVLSREEIRKTETIHGVKTSPVYGRNILIPSTPIHIEKELVKFVESRLNLITKSDISLINNPFKSEVFDDLFWIGKSDKIMSSEMSILLNTSRVTNGLTALKVNVRSLLAAGALYSSSLEGNRGNLYLFAKISKESTKIAERQPYSTFCHQSIFYAPVCNPKKNEEGFIDILIPPAMMPSIHSTNIRIDLMITDLLIGEGFAFRGSLNIKPNSTNYITAIIDIAKENSFISARRRKEVNSDFNQPIGFYRNTKEEANSFLKSVNESVESKNESEKATIKDRTARKETRSLFQAYNLQSTQFFNENDKKKIDAFLAKNMKEWD